MLTGRKLALTLAFAGLLLLAFGAGCRGFFVKPTLSSLTVTPLTPSIEQGSTGNTVQMIATGTYDDGSTGNPPVGWSISPTGIATINTTGLVTSVAEGAATITATATQDPSISGTQSLTVTIPCIESIALQPSSATLSVSNLPTQQFSAMATTCNGVVDVTGSATWNSTQTSVATVSLGLVTAVASGTTDITAVSGAVTSPAALVTVGP